MLELELIRNVAIALLLGSLVGLEREYARYRKHAHDYAGIRTYPLIALFGFLSAYFGNLISVWVLVTGILLTGVLIIFAYIAITRHSKVHFGTTSEVAGFVTFFVGVLCYRNELALAAVIAIVMTTILYFRSFLHNFAEKIQRKELADTLKFAIIAFVILPFLPNKGYGPHEIFNPYIIWLMVVFISGISFAGYIMMKWFGEKGIALSGILAGLISSTALTMNFSQRSKKEVKVYQALVLGVILSNGIMFFRILIEVSVINPILLGQVMPSLLALAAVTFAFAYFLWRKAKKVKGKMDLGSPFTLGPALKFGIFFAVVLALVKIADVYFSSQGVYFISAISGFAGIDAIVVSLSQLSKTAITLDTARIGIIIGTLSNIAVKGGIAFVVGGKHFGRLILGFYSFLIVFGLLLLLL